MSKTVLERYEPEGKKRSEIPITLDWQNAKMVRIHSVIAACREILNMSRSLDVVKVNIIGTPSTGKTTLAETMAHICHDKADIPYTVRIFNRDDLLNFEQTLASLQPTNHILIFDDISFLSATAGKRQMDLIQKTFTEIRHLPGGQDVKIIAIFNFHYNMAVSKYLRQSDFFCYTSIGTSEMENTLDIIGKRYHHTILNFRKINQQALTKGSYTFELGKKGQRLTYQWRKPFAPILFFNNDTCRFVVFPKREWINANCPTCAVARDGDLKVEMDVEKFNEEILHHFPESIVKAALKLNLFNKGVNCFSPRVKQASRWIEAYMKKGGANPEQMALFYNLVDRKTKLRKPLPHSSPSD